MFLPFNSLDLDASCVEKKMLENLSGKDFGWIERISSEIYKKVKIPVTGILLKLTRFPVNRNLQLFKSNKSQVGYKV